MAQPRGQWSGRFGFILAAAGSAIGLGNLWKFPYLTYENQGGAFVLVYFGAVALVGFPIMMAEIILGRRGQLNPVGTFRVLGEGRPGGRAWASWVWPPVSSSCPITPSWPVGPSATSRWA